MKRSIDTVTVVGPPYKRPDNSGSGAALPAADENAGVTTPVARPPLETNERTAAPKSAKATALSPKLKRMPKRRKPVLWDNGAWYKELDAVHHEVTAKLMAMPDQSPKTDIKDLLKELKHVMVAEFHPRAQLKSISLKLLQVAHESDQVRSENKQLKDTVQELSLAQSLLESSNHQLRVQAEKQRALEERVKDLERELEDATRDLRVETQVRQMLETETRELRSDSAKAHAKTKTVRLQMEQLTAAHEEAMAWSQEDKGALERKVEALEECALNARSELFEEMCKVKQEAEELRLQLEELSTHASQSAAERDRLIEGLQERVFQGENLRRTLHNTIQELRGNVRVFARTRPLLLSGNGGGTPVVSCKVDDQTVTLRQQKPGLTDEQERSYTFTFDKVFAHSADQDVIFDGVSELIQSAVDGFNVCIFAYGQTGSGKTHTMEGSDGASMRGIIPRAIEKVLADSEQRQRDGWSYTVEASFLEIYNENLLDLLATKKDRGKALDILKDGRVPDLTRIEVADQEDVAKLMERASRVRSVGSTNMNAKSSRSHAVLTLHLHGVKRTVLMMVNISPSQASVGESLSSLRFARQVNQCERSVCMIAT